jgi:Leucine-rich repeat (LRR) protein
VQLDWEGAPSCAWPDLLCSTGQHVTQLNLVNKRLTGVIPDSINGLQWLQSLDLSLNQLEGVIPSSLGNLTSLQTLALSQNQLSKKIPHSIGNLQSLPSLDLTLNQLSGSIPATLGNLRSLQSLDLSYNYYLTGVIPDSLGKLHALVNLDLSDTHFPCTNKTNYTIPNTPSPNTLKGRVYPELFVPQLRSQTLNSVIVFHAYGSASTSESSIELDELQRSEEEAGVASPSRPWPRDEV